MSGGGIHIIGAGFADNRRPPCHPVDIREVSENLPDRREGARFETVVGADPRHRICMGIGKGGKAAIDCVVGAPVGGACERKLDAFAEDAENRAQGGIPCRQDLQCPVFRPAVLDVIADRERPRLAHHAENRLIEEFLAVENGRRDSEMH